MRSWWYVVALLPVLPGAARAQCPGGEPQPCRGTLRAPPVVAPDTHVIAVLPFRLSGADSSYAEGLSELLAVEFTGEGGPRSADMGTVIRSWRAAGGRPGAGLAMETARAVSARIGAGRFLSASVIGLGQRFTITAQIRRTADGEVLVSASSIQGPEDSLPSMLRRLASQLIALPAGARHAMAETTPEAMRAYIAGLAAYRHSDWQRAAERFTAALAADSTFAPAALGYIQSSGWVNLPEDGGRTRRLAWAFRERLDPLGRTLLRVYLGPRYPGTSTVAEEVESQEAAARTAPDNAEVWFRLGDTYFHTGMQITSDPLRQARSAFARAQALDSGLTEVPLHLASTLLLLHDTAAARVQYEIILRLAPDHEWASNVRYEYGLATGRSRRIGDSLLSVIGQLPSSALGVFHYVQIHPWFPLDTMLLARSFDERLRRATTLAERRSATLMLSASLLNRGRPDAFERAADGLAPAQAAWYRVTGVLFGGADPRPAERAAAELETLMEASAEPDSSRQRAACALGIWKAARDDAAATQRSAARLRALQHGRDIASWCAPLLDAAAAERTGAPDAAGLLATADSIIGAGQPTGQSWEGLALGRMWAARGNAGAALRAVRRDRVLRPRGLMYLAEGRRAEGAWAAAVGDTSGAIMAYRHYLVLRAVPEPVLIPQRDSVRAELARLERR